MENDERGAKEVFLVLVGMALLVFSLFGGLALIIWAMQSGTL